ncbi:MAG: helix-turn-helix transcriptional regulator [Lachnospiraceae bacterium]|jgi:DNA-binding XRE family transcriptional regulator|nr:helix-turn-helix transcriptional regulator [Lachnospiraceae bacterium]
MVDTQYLEKIIDDSGLKKVYLAKKLGISRQSFCKKVKNRVSFTDKEANALCSELGINKVSEKKKIFF